MADPMTTGVKKPILIENDRQSQFQKLVSPAFLGASLFVGGAVVLVLELEEVGRDVVSQDGQLLVALAL